MIFWVYDRAGCFACSPARNRSDCSLSRHPYWTGRSAYRSTGDRSGTCTGTFREVVIGQVIGVFGIRHLASTFAGKTARDRANCGTSRHANGSADSAYRSASYRSRTCATTFCKVVIRQVIRARRNGI